MEDFTGGTGRNRLSGSLDFLYHEFYAAEHIVRPKAVSCDLLVEDMALETKKADPAAVGTAVQVLQSDGRRVSAFVLETLGDAVRVIYSDCSAVSAMVELVARSRLSGGEISACPPLPEQPVPSRPPQRGRRSKPRLAWAQQYNLSV